MLPILGTILSGIFKFAGSFITKHGAALFAYVAGKKSEQLKQLKLKEKEHAKDKNIEERVRRMSDGTVFDELSSKYSRKPRDDRDEG